MSAVVVRNEMKPQSPVGPSPNAHKAAVVMLALGEQASAAVMRHLDPSEARLLSIEIARARSIPAEQTRSIVGEFLECMDSGEHPARGGADIAKRILLNAFGDTDSGHSVGEILKALDEPAESPVSRSSPANLGRLLMGEHPQTIAIILARLEPHQAAAVVAELDTDTRKDVGHRLAKLEAVSPIVMEQITEVMEQKLRTLCDSSRTGLGGPEALAQICNLLDAERSDELLTQLAASDPVMLKKVRDSMFTFEDLTRLDNNAMKQIVAAADRKVLTMALKGTTDELKEQVMKQLSQRAREMFREDMEALGPVRIKEVEAAQEEIVGLIHNLDRQGVISIRNGASDRYVE